MKNYQSNNDEQQVHYINRLSKPTSRILQQSQIFVDQQFQQIRVNIKNMNSERVVKIQTHFFVVEVQSAKNRHKWEIQRRYSDFQWLYNALNFSYPGSILPYFPVKSIENFMVTKLGIQYGEQSKQQHLNMRKDELQVFLNGICSHNLLKQAQQTKIFLKQNKDEFLRLKKAIQAQISESQSEQSSQNGIVSIFERSVAWITSKQRQSQKIENIKQWAKTQQQIRMWVNQYSTLMQKVQKLMEIKASEAQWNGPDSEVDSVQSLKSKVVSSQGFNRAFYQDLKENILKNIQYETKCLKQIQSQLQQRQSIISIINYVYKFSSSTTRSSKLIRKKQKFQINMCREWPACKENLRLKIRAVQKKFNEVWVKYCMNMQKKWKKNN